jgi:hypothetical protein
MDCEDNCIDTPHDFYHYQDTRAVLQEGGKMHPDPPLSSLYTVEIDITELYPKETFQHILRHVLKYVRGIDSVILRRINKFSHDEYELQKTVIVLSVTAIGRILLDIRFPSRRRIRDDRLDQAFRHIFERHGDLRCLHRFP